MEGRTVTVVLLDAAGELLGSVPSFGLELPWWQESADVVAGVRERLGLTVDVLRLLTSERAAPPGGAVTYLAQVRPGGGEIGDRLEPVDPEAAAAALGEDPLRLPYARPGGPADTVRWVGERLPGLVTAEQQRTWNLSAIWRCQAAGGDVAWLKQVPPFFAHEDVVLRWAGQEVPGSVPTLLAADVSTDARRVLLADVPGHDLYGSTGPVRARILALARTVHERSRDALDDLVAAGVPDLRGVRLAQWVRSELAGHLAGHAAAELVDGLAERMAEIDGCGVPDVLVHGDLHPGNAIGDAERVVLIDWGDSFAGHPGFDALRLTVGLDADDAAPLLTQWADGWRTAMPGCDPDRALALLRPVEALRLAAVYAAFLRRIEPSEHGYHRADVPECLDRAVLLAEVERSGAQG